MFGKGNFIRSEAIITVVISTVCHRSFLLTFLILLFTASKLDVRDTLITSYLGILLFISRNVLFLFYSFFPCVTSNVT